MARIRPTVNRRCFSGAYGSSIAAEIGSMKVNEQVDALNVMGQSSIEYLVIPRIIALLLMAPLLVGMADIIAIGGLIVAMSTSMINIISYMNLQVSC